MLKPATCYSKGKGKERVICRTTLCKKVIHQNSFLQMACSSILVELDNVQPLRSDDIIHILCNVFHSFHLAIKYLKAQHSMTDFFPLKRLSGRTGMDHEFEASLGYIPRLRLRKKKLSVNLVFLFSAVVLGYYNSIYWCPYLNIDRLLSVLYL
jgi:hypothetical protein